jgi:hypothetical protein
MDPFSTKDSLTEVEIEGPGPHLFGPDDYRAWMEAQIRSAVKAVLEEVLEAELTAHVGAERSERTESRRGYRNGSHTRRLKTRVGRSRSLWERVILESCGWRDLRGRKEAAYPSA